MKKVLVIGGSYFAGRVFNILSSREGGFDIHVVNRGTRPLKPLDNVKTYISDRHDRVKMAQLFEGQSFDAVIDFCAYATGDIKGIFSALGNRVSQYIFISTSSVYDPLLSGLKKEADPVLYERPDGTVDKYIEDKALLELECIEQCSSHDASYTILRPAFIYGPFNYAPRESYYIKKIVQSESVPNVTDSFSRFSFLYVSDLAHILQKCVCNEASRNEVFNAAGPEEITYASYMEVLRKVSDIPFVTADYTVKEVLDKNIPLPFPLDNNDLVDGRKLKDSLGFDYTPFDSGMKKTFEIFKSVFST